MLLILWVFSPQVRRSKVEGPWQQRYIHLQIWSSTSGRQEVYQAHMGSVFLSIKTSFKGEQQNLYINSKADREHHDVVSENQDCSHVMSPLCCCSWFWVSKRTKRTFLHDLTELFVAVHVKSHRMVLVSHLKPKPKVLNTPPTGHLRCNTDPTPAEQNHCSSTSSQLDSTDSVQTSVIKVRDHIRGLLTEQLQNSQKLFTWLNVSYPHEGIWITDRRQ